MGDQVVHLFPAQDVSVGGHERHLGISAACFNFLADTLFGQWQATRGSLPWFEQTLHARADLEDSRIGKMTDGAMRLE